MRKTADYATTAHNPIADIWQSRVVQGYTCERIEMTSQISPIFRWVMGSAAALVFAAYSTARAQTSPEFTNHLQPSVHVVGTTLLAWNLSDRMSEYGVPGVSIAIIRNGKLAETRAVGVLQAGGTEHVDPETVFSVGSMSKVATAALILKLASEGKLDLDANVNTYLHMWNVPENAFTNQAPITLRRLMSHTAGASIFGFADFQPGAPLPTLVQILEGRPPAKNDPIRPTFVPGSTARYSGGGIVIEQAIVEDVLGMSFAEAATKHLLVPLGMSRSTFRQPLDPAWGNIAKAHDMAGRPVALPRGYETMPETAASGLWTTPSDYARLLAALLASYRGTQGSFLPQALARQMMMAVAPGLAGLGPFIDGAGMSRRIYHSGANDSYRSWMEVNLTTGDGVVITTNGARGLPLYQEIRAALAHSNIVPAGRAIEIPAVSLSEPWQRALAGTYRTETARGVTDGRIAFFPQPATWQVSLTAKGLAIAPDGSPTADPLIAMDDNNFLFASDPTRSAEFVVDSSGRVSRLILRSGLAAIEAPRVP